MIQSTNAMDRPIEKGGRVQHEAEDLARGGARPDRGGGGGLPVDPAVGRLRGLDRHRPHSHRHRDAGRAGARRLGTGQHRGGLPAHADRPGAGHRARRGQAGTGRGGGRSPGGRREPEVENLLQQENSSLFSLQSEYERQRIVSKQAEIQSRQDIGLLEVELEAAQRAMDRRSARGPRASSTPWNTSGPRTTWRWRS